MVADKISTNDIQKIGTYGTLEVKLPNYKACISAKGLVSYTKKMYPREDNLTYTCNIDAETFTIRISTIDKQ